MQFHDLIGCSDSSSHSQSQAYSPFLPPPENAMSATTDFYSHESRLLCDFPLRFRHRRPGGSHARHPGRRAAPGLPARVAHVGRHHRGGLWGGARQGWIPHSALLISWSAANWFRGWQPSWKRTRKLQKWGLAATVLKFPTGTWLPGAGRPPAGALTTPPPHRSPCHRWGCGRKWSLYPMVRVLMSHSLWTVPTHEPNARRP